MKWFLTGWFRCGLMRIHANKLLCVKKVTFDAEEIYIFYVISNFLTKMDDRNHIQLYLRFLFLVIVRLQNYSSIKNCL